MVSSVSSHTDYATKQHYCYVFKVRGIPVKASLLAFACFLITNHDISAAAAAERNKKCVCVCGGGG